MKKNCSVKDCEHISATRIGYCLKHYKRWQRHGDPLKTLRGEKSTTGLCLVEGCAKEHVAKGLCGGHYARYRATGEVPTTLLVRKEFRGIKGRCLRTNCVGTSRGTGYCARHAQRLSHLRNKYGIYSFEDLDSIYDQQNRTCAICDENLELEDKGTHIDHDHSTGLIRGILCENCNRGLGMFKDSPKLLANAIDYLIG